MSDGVVSLSKALMRWRQQEVQELKQERKHIYKLTLQVLDWPDSLIRLLISYLYAFERPFIIQLNSILLAREMCGEEANHTKSLCPSMIAERFSTAWTSRIVHYNSNPG